MTYEPDFWKLVVIIAVQLVALVVMGKVIGVEKDKAEEEEGDV